MMALVLTAAEATPLSSVALPESAEIPIFVSQTNCPSFQLSTDST